jgi:hypothetical protein
MSYVVPAKSRKVTVTYNFVIEGAVLYRKDQNSLTANDHQPTNLPALISDKLFIIGETNFGIRSVNMIFLVY